MLPGKLLNKLRKINRIRHINAGGCAIAAYALKQHIDTYYPTLSTDSSIVFLFDDEDPDYDVYLDQGYSSCGHAVVRIGKYYYDSKSYYTLNQLHRKWDTNFELEVPNDAVLDSINHSPNWNRAFRRKGNVKHIANIFDIDLSKVKIYD